MAKKISFIITTREEPAAILEATLDGLLVTSAGHPHMIVVDDDGSTVPASVDLPRAFLVRHETPLGVAHSRRHGASVAGGDALVWLDAHMSFGPGWLEQMSTHVDSGALLCLVELRAHTAPVLGSGFRLARRTGLCPGRFPGVRPPPPQQSRVRVRWTFPWSWAPAT